MAFLSFGPEFDLKGILFEAEEECSRVGYVLGLLDGAREGARGEVRWKLSRARSWRLGVWMWLCCLLGLFGGELACG